LTDEAAKRADGGTPEAALEAAAGVTACPAF
jgi:hypothetical protein